MLSIRFHIRRDVSFVVSVMVLTLLGPAVSSAPDGDEVRAIGQVPADWPDDRFPATGHWEAGWAPLVVNPASRRAFQLFTLDDPRRIGVRSFDLDTLRLKRFATSSIAQTGGDARIGVNGISGFPLAVDQKRKRVFFPMGIQGELTLKILVLDEDRMDRGEDPISARIDPPTDPLAAASEGLRATKVRGLTAFDDAAGRPKLLVIYEHASSSSMFVTQWDVEKALRGDLTRDDWGAPFKLADCRAIQPTRSPVPVFRSTRSTAIFTFCRSLSSQRTLVVRIQLNAAGLPDVAQTTAGPMDADVLLADPAVDRLHAVSSRGSSRELWTFDGGTGRWVGRAGVTLGPLPGTDAYGIDQQSGRIYALAPNQPYGAGGVRLDQSGCGDSSAPGGLMIIEGRMTPIPQPLLFNEFAYPSVVPIQIDPARPGRKPRIFVRRSPDFEQNPNSNARIDRPAYPTYPAGKCIRPGAEPFWTVVEDGVPVAKDPIPGDQDRLTVDVQERSGITGSAMEASGGAYALRIRAVNGASVPLTCGPFSRLVTAGYVKDAKFAPQERGAAAEALSADEITRGDVRDPASRCQPQQGTRPDPPGSGLGTIYKSIDAILQSTYTQIDKQVGREWDFPSVSCVEGDDEANDEARSTPAADLRAKVSCQPKNVHAEAAVSLKVGTALRIGDATSKVTVGPDPTEGIRATAVSRLSAVRIDLGSGSWLGFDSIQTVAAVHSNGRPEAEPRGSFVRTVCGIHGPGGDDSHCYRDVHGPAGALCKDPPERPEQQTYCTEGEVSGLAAVVNTVAGGRARIRVPTPDALYLKGSPKGYVAAIQKTAPARFDDELQNGDPGFEVPGLEIIRETDGSERQVIQLAGVRVATTYGIYCLPPRVYVPSKGKCLELPAGFDQGTPGSMDPSSRLDGAEGLGVREPTRSDPGGLITATASTPDAKRFRVLIIRSFGQGLAAAAVWFTLLLPVALAWRRRSAMSVLD